MNLFEILGANQPVKNFFAKGSELKIYPWGRAPQDVKPPYAVYSVINGLPQNYLDNTPDIDAETTQINIYAANAGNARTAFLLVRDALEPYAHMTNYSTPDLDAETNLYSCRMEFDYWHDR